MKGRAIERERPMVRGSKAGGRATGQRRYCYLNIVFVKQVLCHPFPSATSFPCKGFALLRRNEFTNVGCARRPKSDIYRRGYLNLRMFDTNHNRQTSLLLQESRPMLGEVLCASEAKTLFLRQLQFCGKPRLVYRQAHASIVLHANSLRVELAICMETLTTDLKLDPPFTSVFSFVSPSTECPQIPSGISVR